MRTEHEKERRVVRVTRPGGPEVLELVPDAIPAVEIW
jgi:hypothetical protein